MLEFIQFLIVAVIVGGMVTFQILFAPLIFIKLPNDVARPFIRKFFPFYYLYFGLLSIALCGVSYLLLEQSFGTTLFAAFVITAVGFIVSRQIFMPLANRATDQDRQADFTKYHRITVLINTVQLVTMIVALWLLT
jgi:hypothetical protein